MWPSGILGSRSKPERLCAVDLTQNHSSSQHCQQKLVEIVEAEARPQKIAATG